MQTTIVTVKTRAIKLPAWFRQEILSEISSERVSLLEESHINTVCQLAKCPNLNYCFGRSRFTFIILGEACTRNCGFCAVNKSGNTKQLDLDEDEPYRIAEFVKRLGLNYAVITSVTRDDLEDGGAKVFARTVELIHGIRRDIKVEALIPDFKGNSENLKYLLDAAPDVIAHNIETVKRLYKNLRPEASYELSLEILKKIKELKPNLVTKSSIMLGLGETETEIINCMEDLRYSNCDLLTLGQYLAPSVEHYPIKDFIGIEQFQRYRRIGLSLGFSSVLSGPLVRSSYRAEELYRELIYA